MSEAFKFKPTQKFRVISGNISFRTTARDIRKGVGDHIAFNSAVLQCFESLEKIKSGKGWADQCATGLSGIWDDVHVQLDVAA